MKHKAFIPLLSVISLVLVTMGAAFIVTTRDYALTVLRAGLGQTVPTCGCETLFLYSNHPYLYSALLLLSAAVIVFGVAALLHIGVRVFRTQRYLRQLQRAKITSNTINIQNRVFLVHTIQSTDSFAFCSGVLRPAIYVSTRTRSALSNEAYTAVLHHEAAHIQLFHIAQRLLIEACISLLPASTNMRARLFAAVEASLEQQADQWALQYVSRDALLSACISLIDTKQRNIQETRSLAVALTAFSGMDSRIEHLLGKRVVVFRGSDLAALLLASAAVMVTLLYGMSIPTRAAEKDSATVGQASFCVQEQERIRSEAKRMDISLQSIELQSDQCIIPTMSVDPKIEINYPK